MKIFWYDLVMYKSTVVSILNDYIDKVEEHISELFSDGEKLIYKQLNDQGRKLDMIGQAVTKQGQFRQEETSIYTLNP